ncbi:hypothetical protein M5D96_007534 [Drosophila gunungcola]|uniref:Uncharacterized protein n=1 Tax=Drosophila gunungcola TaxID=103775 RepID=A0A9P9YN98_9MUSC|nr:hypothetical protein M5D96_007534 [Drosophila gunungcola]
MSNLRKSLMGAYGRMGVSQRMDWRVPVHQSILGDGLPVPSKEETPQLACIVSLLGRTYLYPRPATIVILNSRIISRMMAVIRPWYSAGVMHTVSTGATNLRGYDSFSISSRVSKT